MLWSPVPSQQDRFGRELAIDGDVLVVGDTHAGDDPALTGLVSVYRFHDREWRLDATLTDASGQQNDQFGWSVAVHGDCIVVGALSAEDGLDEAGSAHVFRYAGGEWAHEDELIDPNPGIFRLFGSSVAIEGDKALVGAYGADVQDGRVFVFQQEEGSWFLDDELVPIGATNQQRFGFSVDLVGGVAVVGAPQHRVTGAAFVFRHEEGNWEQEALLLPSGAVGLSPCFGSDVCLGDAGETVVGTAPTEDGVATDSGAVFLFHRVAGNWDSGSKLIASDAGAHQIFGTDLDVDGDRAVIGAVHDPEAIGQAYVVGGITWTDCNANDEPDACDIHQGVSDDTNSNGIPDECELAGDVDANGVVDVGDLIRVILNWGKCAEDCQQCPGDANADCCVGAVDLAIVIVNWS